MFFSVLVILIPIRYMMIMRNYSTTLPGHQITGRIINNPADKSYGQAFTLMTEREQKLLIRSSSEDRFVYNDMVKMEVDCERPKNFETDLGSTFDYVTYLKKDHIYYICETSTIRLLYHDKSILEKLYQFSNFLGSQIEYVFKSPHNAFVGGVLVGDKTNIPNDIRNDFIKTGTIHILALSGYNIAIVALFFQYIFIRLFRKRAALVLSGLSVLVFVAMTGFMASAIRAGLMAIIVIYAQLTYQKYSPLRALLVVSYLMILYDPFYLLYDSSFHLSFLATFGVVAMSPTIHAYLDKIPTQFLRATVSTTLGAYIMTFPYLMHFFSGLSLVGIIANIIILPFIPLFMFTSAVALGTSFISFPLAFVPSVVTEYLSQGILSIIHLFARVPLGYIPISISGLWCIVLYVLIFWVFYKLQKKLDIQH